MTSEEKIVNVPSHSADELRALRQLAADVFRLHLKIKNLSWHIRGGLFPDAHPQLDEHAEQIFAIADDLSERARTIGNDALHTLGAFSLLSEYRTSFE